MARSARDCLLECLENLNDGELRKFKTKLNELPVRKGYDNIPRGKLQKAEALDLTNILVSYYAEQYAVKLTAKVLKAINCKDRAKELLAATGNTLPRAQPAGRGRAAPRGSLAAQRGRVAPRGSLAAQRGCAAPRGSLAAQRGRAAPRGSLAAQRGSAAPRGSLAAQRGRAAPRGSLAAQRGSAAPRGSLAAQRGRAAPRGSRAAQRGRAAHRGLLAAQRGCWEFLGDVASNQHQYRELLAASAEQEVALGVELLGQEADCAPPLPAAAPWPWPLSLPSTSGVSHLVLALAAQRGPAAPRGSLAAQRGRAAPRGSLAVQRGRAAPRGSLAAQRGRGSLAAQRGRAAHRGSRAAQREFWGFLDDVAAWAQRRDEATGSLGDDSRQLLAQNQPEHRELLAASAEQKPALRAELLRQEADCAAPSPASWPWPPSPPSTSGVSHLTLATANAKDREGGSGRERNFCLAPNSADLKPDDIRLWLKEAAE